MTLKNKLIKSLSEWRPETRDNLLVADAESGWTVQVSADRCETLGCQVWELTITRATPIAERTLAAWAGGIADKTLGLLEPLRVVEVDDPQLQALVRSKNPSEEEGKLFYYEVLLKGTTSALVRRYQASPDGSARREQVSFVLTHEALASVVGSLTTAP